MITEVSDVSALNEGNVLVDFYTDTCAPCKAMNPILEEISEEYADVKVAKVDVVRNPDMSQMFGVMSVPTFIFIKNRRVKSTIQGLSNKQALKLMIKKGIND